VDGQATRSRSGHCLVIGGRHGAGAATLRRNTHLTKHIALAGLAIALLFGALPAQAGIWPNGLQLNGFVLNGTASTVVAPTVSGLTLPSGVTFTAR
jgi:hypothetical protein